MTTEEGEIMWNIYDATAQGILYFNEGKNNQDAVAGYSDSEMAIGIICDGCHGGENSEVGARLSAPFLVRNIKALLLEGIPLREIPMLLFELYMEYLRSHINIQFLNENEVHSYIDNFLLCTVIGLVIYKGEVLLLNCGDGSFYLDNAVYLVKTSPNDRPSYAAYNLYEDYGIVERGVKELVSRKDGKRTKIPDGFEVAYLEESDIHLLGIASDGLNRYPHLFDELRLHAYSNISLKLCLNRIVVIDEETTDNVTCLFVVKGK